jgi:hypothetical protein
MPTNALFRLVRTVVRALDNHSSLRSLLELPRLAHCLDLIRHPDIVVGIGVVCFASPRHADEREQLLGHKAS